MDEINKKKYFKQRLLLLVVYSLLVNFSSWVMFPNTMILFSILHFIAVASILGLLFIRLRIINLFPGLTIILMGQFLEFSLFNQLYLHWIGLMTQLPVTVDYAPLFPWFGLVLVGMYFGQLLLQRPANSALLRWQCHHPVTNLITLRGTT